jgi:hypothetical protein
MDDILALPETAARLVVIRVDVPALAHFTLLPAS